MAYNLNKIYRMPSFHLIRHLMKYGWLIIYKIVYKECVMYGLCGTGIFTVSKTLLCLPTHNQF